MSVLEIKHYPNRFCLMNVFKTCVILVAMTLPFSVFSQIGIRLSYEQANYDDWAQTADKAELLKLQYAAGIEYWFRMKNVRIEYFPELYYLSAMDSGHADFKDFKYSINALGISGKIHFYIMDFFGDCDCPTFSKEGNFFTKGFYLAMAPGFQMDLQKINNPIDNLVKQTSNIHFKINLGAGLDLGIMDKWTVSPFIFYNLSPTINWVGFGDLHGKSEDTQNSDKSIQRAIQTGIRVHYRWDY